jgi:hypothetical protein
LHQCSPVNAGPRFVAHEANIRKDGFATNRSIASPGTALIEMPPLQKSRRCFWLQ